MYTYRSRNAKTRPKLAAWGLHTVSLPCTSRKGAGVEKPKLGSMVTSLVLWALFVKGAGTTTQSLLVLTPWGSTPRTPRRRQPVVDTCHRPGAFLNVSRFHPRCYSDIHLTGEKFTRMVKEFTKVILPMPAC